MMTPSASSLLGFSALMMPLSCEKSSSTLPGCAIPATTERKRVFTKLYVKSSG